MRDNLCLILTIPLAAAITFGLFSVTQAKRHRESESKANKTAEQWKRDYEIEHRHCEYWKAEAVTNEFLALQWRTNYYLLKTAIDPLLKRHRESHGLDIQ